MARDVDDEFRLSLTPRPDGSYDALGIGPDATVHHGTFRLPIDAATLERAVLGVAASATRSVTAASRDVGGAAPPAMDAQELGGTLADALLQGELGAAYDDARRRAAAAGRALRLALSLGAAPALLSVPWELLYRRPTFLANQRQTPVVRHLDVPDLPEPLTIEGPVRILGVVANPADTAPLDVAAERGRVERAVAAVVAAGEVTLDWLEPATPRRLREVLRDGTYHVLHYVGHGDFTPSGEGVLYLEAGDDEPGPGRARGGHTELDSAELASLLADQTSLRLVVLNSCEGARTSLTDPFAGVATTLVHLGVPAVIAMQFPISDAAAILFAEELYTNLIGRRAPVDVAVSEARKAIYIEQGTVEWATPVLFVGDTAVELFRFEAPAAPGAGDVPPAPVAAPAAPRRRRLVVPVAVAVLAVLAVAAVVALALRAGGDDPGTVAGGAPRDPAATETAPAATGAAAPGAAEPAPGAPLDGPVTFTGSIERGGGTADFPLDLAVGQVVYIGAGTACGADLRYHLDDPSGALRSGFPRAVCQDIGRLEVTSTGTHVLRVVSAGAATGPFALTVTPVRPDVVATVGVGEAAVGTIDEPGARDRHTVDLVAGDLLYLDGRGPCGADLRYQLTSPSGRLTLGFDRAVCQDGGRVVVTETGAHELRVDGRERATGGYDILVAPVRPDGGGPLGPGATAEGVIDQPGARDVHTFDVGIGDRVALAPGAPCGADLRYEVRSPSGALPLGFAFRTCDAGDFTATEAGPHTLTVSGVETATGPYALTLTVTSDG